MYQYASAVQALYASDPVLSVCGRRRCVRQMYGPESASSSVVGFKSR